MKTRFNGSGGKFSKHSAQNRAVIFMSFDVSLTVSADSGEHDSSQVAFQQSVRLSQRIIQPRAFFKFASIHIRLAQHFLGGFAALGAHRIKFKNNSGCPANRQFDVWLSLSHADRIASQLLPRHVQKADLPISVCLTSSVFY